MNAFDELSRLYVLIEDDMALLSGERVGRAIDSWQDPAGAWQDIAGTLAVNLRVLASRLDDLRNGKAKFAGRFPIEPGSIVFPSMAETVTDREEA